MRYIQKSALKGYTRKPQGQTPKLQGCGVICQKPWKKAHHYVYSRESWLGRCRGVAEWRLSSLNFESEKFVLIQNAKRPQQTKFQLPIMFGSREIKSSKIAYHLYKSYFKNEISSPPIQMIGDYIFREPSMIESWNFVSGGLLAFSISTNFLPMHVMVGL